MPLTIFTPAHKPQAERKELEEFCEKITDSPACTTLNELSDCEPGMRLLSSKLQPVKLMVEVPTFVNSTNSPLVPSYIHSVIRICEKTFEPKRRMIQRLSFFFMF